MAETPSHHSEIEAYSLKRFSSSPQEDGDSVRRQTAGARAWAERNGLPLDESLKCDRAVSAFRGKNRVIGALADFLDRIARGRVKRGSYLVVESLDRLTREKVQDALRLILNILGAGIRIVQLKPVEVVYDEGSDTMPLIIMIVELSRGHSESATKSFRLTEIRAEQRSQARAGKPSKHRHPGWVSWDEDAGRYALVPARAAVVKRIYELADAGVGAGRIAARLNREKVPTVSGAARWNRTYLLSVLTDCRAVGAMQPRQGPAREPSGLPVEGYYPAAVERPLFDRVAAAMARRRKRGDAPYSAAVVNPFVGLLRCALTGEPLVINPVSKPGGRSYRVLVRQGYGQSGDTLRGSFSYDTFRRAVLSRLRELDVSRLLDVEGGGDGGRGDELEGRVAELEATRQDLKARVKVKRSATLYEAIDEVEAELAALNVELARCRAAHALPASDAWGEAKGLLEVIDGAPDREQVQMRLRSLLRSLLESVDCVMASRGLTRLCAAQVRFAGGGHVRDYLIGRRKAVTNGRNAGLRQPARWCVLSLPLPADGVEVDFRDRAQAEGLRLALERMDVSALPWRDEEDEEG